MNRKYYPYRFRLFHKDRFLIWRSDDYENDLDNDGVVVDEQQQRILVFDRLTSFLEKTEHLEVKIEDYIHANFVNLDTTRKWLKRKRPAKIDCHAMLKAWNLFADISRTLGEDFDSERYLTFEVYDKIFWGSNLPAMTSDGKFYKPIWCRSEVRLIRMTMKKGFEMFRKGTSI